MQSSDDMEDVLDISTENLALLKEEAQMVDTDILGVTSVFFGIK